MVVQAGDKLGFPPKADDVRKLFGDLLLYAIGGLLLFAMDRLRRR